jgi:fibronectin-binding autotransporter adhesin
VRRIKRQLIPARLLTHNHLSTSHMKTTRKPARILTSTIAVITATLPNLTHGADVFWDRGSATNAWGTGGNWSPTDVAAAAGGAVPAAADVAVFNISALTSNQTIDLGADRTIAGLRFVSSGTSLIQAGGTNRLLTIGASGIVKSGAGAVTIGSGTANQNVGIRLSADQTWQSNNNSSALVINNTLTASSAANRILTLGGSSTATNQINAVISNNGAGVFSLVKSGASLWVLNAANTFSGGTTLSAGTLRVLNNSGLGTGTLTFGSGSTGRLQINNGVTISNNIVIDSGVAGVVGQGLIDVSGTGRRTVAGTITLNGSPSAGGTFRAGNGIGDELVIAGALNGSVPSASQRDGRIIYSGGGSLAGNFVVTGTILSGATNGIPQGLNVLLGGSGAGTLDLNGFSQTLAGVTLGNATNAFAGTTLLRSGTLTLNGDIATVASTAAANNLITGYGGGSIDFGATARNINVADNTSAVDLTIADTSINSGGGLTKTGVGVLSLNNVNLSGSLTAASGGVSIGGGGLTTSALSLNGVTMNFGGQIANSGTLTASGSNVINYVPVGAAPGIGDRNLITYTGATPGLSAFTLGTLGPRMVATLKDTGTAIALDITANDSITWTGSADANWDGTTINWQTTNGVAPTNYLSGDHVKFDDTGLNTNINLAAGVTASRLEFTHTTPNTYSITGTGSLQGEGDIVHSGTGSTRIGTLNNSIAGPILVTGGSLELDHGAVANQTVLTNARVNVSSGATLRLTSDNVDFNYTRPISGAGTVVVDLNSGGTAGSRTITFSGQNEAFSGTLSLTPTAASGTFRLIANSAGVLGTSTIDVNDGGQFWPQNGQNYSNNMKLSGTGYSEAAGGAAASIASSTTGGVYIGTGTPLFSYAGIGAIRGEGQTLSGNIDLEGSAKISAHNGILTLSGVISGDSSETLVVGGGSDANTVFFTGNNTYAGRTWINGGSTNAAARTVLLQVGNNTTTGSLGTGEVVLYANPLHTALLRIQRSDGYTLAPGQNIVAAAAASADLAGRANLQLNTQGTGFTTNGNTIDLSDGTNAGQIQVGTNVNGAIVNFNGASVIDVGNFFLGDQTNFSATVNQNDTTSVTSIGRLQIGHFPTETSNYNMNGGSIDMALAAPATFPYTTGSTEQLGGIYLGIDGTGNFTQTGGFVTTNFMVLDNRVNTVAGTNMPTGIDTYQMNGGTLILKGSQGIITRHASTAVNLNGGIIQASAGSTPALDSNTITVQSGGVTLDGNGGNAFSLYGALDGTGTVILTGGTTLRTLDGNATATTAGGVGAGLGGSLGAIPISFSASEAVEYNRTGTDTWTGSFTGAGTIVKNNTGTLNLAGNLTSLSGPIQVNSGLLEITGTVAATQNVTVADNAELRAEKTIGNLTIGTTVGGAVGFNPNTVATLAVNNLNASGTNVVNFEEIPTGAAPWTALTYNTSSGTGTWSLGVGYRGGSVTDTGFSVQVDNVTRKPITWTGATNSTWDLNTTQNWNDSVPVAENFFQADDVTFGDGPTNTNITLTGSLRPWKVAVNAATTNYTFTSTAGNQLSGPIGIEKSGASTLTLVGPNANTRKTIISGGTISIVDAASLGSGVAGNSIELSNSGKLDISANTAFNLGTSRNIEAGTSGGSLNVSGAIAGNTTVNYTIPGNLSGTTGLSFTASGANATAATAAFANYVLTGSNSGFSGPITLGATSSVMSSLTINSQSAVPSTSLITLNYPANAVTSGNATTLALNGVTLAAGTTIELTAFNTAANISQRSQVTGTGDSIIMVR